MMDEFEKEIQAKLDGFAPGTFLHTREVLNEVLQIYRRTALVDHRGLQARVDVLIQIYRERVLMLESLPEVYRPGNTHLLDNARNEYRFFVETLLNRKGELHADTPSRD